MNVQDITVDLSKKNVKPESVVLRQGDKSGTTLRVKVLDGGVDVSSLSGYTAKFVMKLPNDTFYYEVEGTISGGTVEFLIDESQAASEAGVTNIAYVTLVNGDTTKTSANNVRVEILPSALDGITPPPEWMDPIDEFIEEQTERVDEVVTRATEAAEAAEGVVLQDVPLMSSTVRGGAQLGDGLAIVDGKLTATGGGSYQLPTMSASTKGGAKLGDGLSVSNDTLSLSGESYTSAEKIKLAGVEAGANNYSLPTMGEYIKGGALLGDGLTVEDDTLSLSGESYTSAEKTKLAGIEANANNYTLPTMGASTKGGAKLGSGLVIANDVLSLDSHAHNASDIMSGEIPIAHGGTGASTAVNARNNLSVLEYSSGVFNVGGTSAYLLFKTTAIASFSPPTGVSACMVLDTSDNGLYWYTS